MTRYPSKRVHLKTKRTHHHIPVMLSAADWEVVKEHILPKSWTPTFLRKSKNKRLQCTFHTFKYAYIYFYKRCDPCDAWKLISVSYKGQIIFQCSINKKSFPKLNLSRHIFISSVSISYFVMNFRGGNPSKSMGVDRKHVGVKRGGV